MRVEVILEVAALDILMPLTLVLDGDAIVLRTTTAIDFSPEVCHRVARHRHIMLCRQACVWLHSSHRWSAHRRQIVRVLHRWLAPPLMERGVDGGDYKLVDVMVPLFHRRG
jgi:hypothetical protein